MRNGGKGHMTLIKKVLQQHTLHIQAFSTTSASNASKTKFPVSTAQSWRLFVTFTME